LALLPVSTWAATDSPQELGELCLLPGLGKALSQYRQLAARGGWPQVVVGPTLREDDQNERIPMLKKRLAASGDLPVWASQGDLFEVFLHEAVLRFQTRHGLTADGLVGPKTLRELNVSISERIRQLEASLARCQPLPPLLERRHILVNIADFTLKLFEDGKLVLAMPVIVGRTYRKTPVFSGLISSLILNPSWNVPHSIATKDLLPKIKKNPGYLRKSDIRVFLGWNPGTEQEIFSREELVEAFSLDRVQKSGAVFDLKKLDWVQGQWMRKIPPEDFAARIKPLVVARYPAAADDEKFIEKAALIQARITFFPEAVDMLSFFYEEPKVAKDLLVNPKQGVTEKDLSRLIELLQVTLKNIPESEWNTDSLKNAIEAVVVKENLKRGQLLWPLRAALTGREYSPGAYEVAGLLGKDKTIERLKKAGELMDR